MLLEDEEVQQLCIQWHSSGWGAKAAASAAWAPHFKVPLSHAMTSASISARCLWPTDTRGRGQMVGGRVSRLFCLGQML